MTMFFDPLARVIVKTNNQPQGSIKIISQAWEYSQDNDDFPPACPPLRRQLAVDNILPGDGIVHVSTITGERHTRGEIEIVNGEPGMVKVVAEGVKPLRPLANVDYINFVSELDYKVDRFFKLKVKKIDKVINKHINNHEKSIVTSYLY
ncbi:hypothetical protein N9L02_02250 [Gammaproteobacteria bacterium]|nr:hypothetical protein [Gammaproteobacteria bacterium]